MAVINVLSPHVADLIAAGEVVERPGSVVKELLENSFDAGAKNITVELRGGGAALIRVTDDGCGMSPDDAATAFLRHATSKLRDARGLEAIATMGFRGEALAAVAAVSRIELTTREKGADTGVAVSLEAGEVLSMREAGCPEGTTITVRDLFFNTPARLKFLKSDRAEAAWCVNLALRCALGRPEVSVRCIKDGAEEFFTPGDGRAESCVYSLLGRELASGLLPCESEDAGVRVSGFVCEPGLSRGNRAHQYFFVNSRSIRSQSMQAALEQAYRNRLLPGRFPYCTLYIELSPGAVDVNVHPTKAEVKFSDEKKIFDGVYYAAMAALDSGRGKVGENPPVAASPRQPPLTRGLSSSVSLRPERPRGGNSGAVPINREPQTSSVLRSPQIPYNAARAVSPPLQGEVAFAKQMTEGAGALMNPPVAPSERQPPLTRGPEPAPEARRPLRVVGEAMNTYIIAERGDELLLIDKHAAHERIIFDRLRAESRELLSQTLLLPAPIRAGADAELIERNLALLSELGFELEPYGADTFMLRALPDGVDAADGPAAVEELCEKLRRNKSAEPESVRDAILKTVACKAAIKAGKSSEPSELLTLAERVASGEVRYCPHGRPVCVTLTKKELDKLFKRIV